MNKTKECLGCCEPKNKLLELNCGHQEFCVSCCNNILIHDAEKKLKCPMCRKPSYITSDKDINNQILENELLRPNFDDIYHDDIYHDIYHYIIRYGVIYIFYNCYNIKLIKPISYNVFKMLKIRNNNVVKTTYL